MPKNDDSDNPIKGFEIIHHPEHTYLRCRGRECYFIKPLPRQLRLEELLHRCAIHRLQCTKPIQAIKTECAVQVSWVEGDEAEIVNE